MSAALTLYIVHTARDPTIGADLTAALRWASAYGQQVVLVVPPGRREGYAECGADRVYESPAAGDFQFYDGLYQALHEGLPFEQVICLRDDAMPLGRGLDEKFNQAFYADGVDLIGAADRNYYGESFSKLAAFFSECRIPHERWDKPPASHTIYSAVFALTARLARELFHRRLLVAPKLPEWPLSFGAYATWTCQLLMLQVAYRGSMNRPLAPLYVNDGWGGAYNPPPYLLHPSVLVYWSLRHVVGYSESETRAWCKRLRESRA